MATDSSYEVHGHRPSPLALARTLARTLVRSLALTLTRPRRLSPRPSASQVHGYRWVFIWYCTFCFDQLYIKHVVDAVQARRPCRPRPPRRAR